MRFPLSSLALTIVCASGLIAGCGDPEPLTPILIRVLDQTTEGSEMFQGTLVDGRPLSFDDFEHGWLPFRQVGTDLAPATDSEAWDTPLVARETGRWVHGFPVVGEESYVVVGHVEFDGVAPEASAGLSVLEFDGPLPTDGSADGMLGNRGGQRVLGEDGSGDLRIEFEVQPDAEWIAISFTFNPEDGGGSARLIEFEIYRFGDREELSTQARNADAALAQGLAAVGRYAVEATTRRGVALTAGGEMLIPLEIPAEVDEYELHLGLIPLDTWEHAVEMSATVDILVGDATVPLCSGRCQANQPIEARWKRLRGEWPVEARGRSSTLRIRVVGQADSRAALVVADMQLSRQEPADQRLNVILISLDTLRADRLGSYGYERPTSPNIDHFAKRAMLFENTRAQAPYTLPSHFSMLSGQFPSVHGVQDISTEVDTERTQLLASILSRVGYQTAAFTGGGFLQTQFGFDHGFDRFGIVDPILNLDSERIRGRLRVDAQLSLELARENTIERVINWLDEAGEEPFFLFLHTYMTHDFDAPLEALAELGLTQRKFEEDIDARRTIGMPGLDRIVYPDAEILARMHDYYDGTVRHMDRELGKLLDYLDRTGLLDETVVVITSDHGKEIGERGVVGHGTTLYDELIHVPLIIHVPGLEPRRDDRPAMSVDIVPTILDALRLPAIREAQGWSLLRPHEPRSQFSEVDNYAVKYALVSPAGKKTIWSPLNTGTRIESKTEWERFDLESDPSEGNNLTVDAETQARIQGFHSDLKSLGEALGSGRARGDLDPQVIANLRALGYLDVGN